MRITYIRMRHFRLSQMILAAVLTASAAYAQAPPQTAPAAVVPSAGAANARQDALAPLFDALKRERDVGKARGIASRSEEHTSELQSLMRNSYAVFCLKK